MLVLFLATRLIPEGKGGPPVLMRWHPGPIIGTDPATPLGRLVRDMLSTLGDREREFIIERVRGSG